ncbi:hypothetical protein [Paenibacillus sp. WLX2291]|uniref:hypothetical protein n=1 Tax=Paenibacillus sp. WLX2291 TaxID=3296934 RepID=UPI003983E4BD
MEEVIQPDKRKFQYLKRTTEFNFKKNNFLNFLIEFDSYKKRFSSGGLQEQGELQKSLEIEITFDFKYNLLIIKCGEQSYVNIIKKIFSQNLKSISFESLSIKPLVKQINFAGEANFHNQSYFILDFLFSKLRTNNFEANDYLAISFSNNKKEIKKTSVAGNNLFAEPTVEERLISLDAINAVKFQLAKVFVNQETGTSANLDEIRMDFRQQLKITFYKEQNDSYHRSYIHHIVTSLKEGLNGTHDCQNTEKLLKVIRS